jgi:Protein of unknown function (DUF2690)
MRRVARGAWIVACAAALLVTAQPVAGLAAPVPNPDSGQGAVLRQTADGPRAFLAPTATSGCGSLCDGKDPQTYRIYTSSTAYRLCATDATTVRTATNIELRYSPWCRTAWARQTGSIGYLVGVLVHSFNTNGSLRTYYRNDHMSGSWSAMVNDAGLTARACDYFYRTELEYEQNIWYLGICTGRY